MKVVLPVHHFPPKYSAGAELYTYRLARWLRAHGHQPEVVCVEAIDQGKADAITAVADTYDGIPVHRLSFDLARAPQRERWDYDNPLLGDWFERYLRQAAPDLVHFHAGYLIGAAPMRVTGALGVPAMLTLHDYWFLCPRITLQRGDGSLCDDIPSDPAGCDWCMKLISRRYRIPDQMTGGLAGSVARAVALKAGRDEMANRRAVMAEVLTVPEVVIAPSRFLAGKFAHILSPSQLRVVSYGMNLDMFRKQRRPPPDGVIRFGFVGQISPHKGVHVLISAFRQLQTRGRKVELHLFGGLNVNLDYVAQLRQLAASDARIHFRGRFESKLVAETLAGLDVTATPSLWYDNSPLAIHESRAAGVPVIVSTLGGMPELITHDVDGLHVKPGDATDLTRQMQRMLDEPALLPRLRAGVAANPPRDIEDEMRELMAVYERVTAARSVSHVA
jgi:glycosyltransferase involved in cell wall biosynthesis